MLSFRLLGPLSVGGDGTAAFPASSRIRSVVAAMALRPGGSLSTTDLATWIWGDAAVTVTNPAAAVHTYVSRTRRLLRSVLPSGHCVDLRTIASGYMLQADAGWVDAVQFERGVEAAHELAGAGDRDGAAAELASALALWSGSALANVPATPPAVAAGTRLNELRLMAKGRLINLRLSAGGADSVVAELAELTAEHPLRESFTRQFMVALDRCGNRGAALGAYRRLYERLRDEVGVEPSTALRDLHTALLRDERPPGPPPEVREPAARPAAAAACCRRCHGR